MISRCKVDKVDKLKIPQIVTSIFCEGSMIFKFRHAHHPANLGTDLHAGLCLTICRLSSSCDGVDKNENAHRKCNRRKLQGKETRADSRSQAENGDGYATRRSSVYWILAYIRRPSVRKEIPRCPWPTTTTTKPLRTSQQQISVFR